MKPFLSVDCETTGIDAENNKILQLAAIWDDGSADIDKLPFIDILINYEGIGLNILHNNYALGINGKIFKAIAEKDSRTMLPENARGAFNEFCKTVSPKDRITPAGKNFAGFDLPFLKSNGFSVDQFKHRVLDVGPLYFPDFGYVPSLDEINKRLGRPPVAHDALGDCKDVIYAIRQKVKK